MKLNRTTTVCILLLAAWSIICIWQLLEHNRVKASAREALRNRARDISYSLATVIRSQERFGRIWQARLEAALEGLAKSEELQAVALLNASGDVVTSAGEPIDLDTSNLLERGDLWGKMSVTFVNPIDLGSAIEEGGTSRPAMIVVPPDSGDRRDRPDRRGPQRPKHQSVSRTSESVVWRLEFPPNITTSSITRRWPEPLRILTDYTSEGTIMEFIYPPNQPTTPLLALMRPDSDRDRFRRGGGRRRGGPPPFGRPPWMDEARYRELIQKQGLHGFVLKMSTGAFRAESARDLWLRMAIASIALVAAIGLGLNWRALDRSARLQLRLLRASEMNAHLREMNVAAAGLAHETRNPLNIVRGLAQMIAKADDGSPEIRERSSEITEEVDRVTARLNEFIDYSKPRQAKPAPTNLNSVVRDVERTLETDREDKAIEFVVLGPDLTVEADETLLRQVLFNLLINSVRAVSHGGKVEVVLENSAADGACFEIRDNGPGVPADARDDVFRPYFTTHEGGTGLGLAIVRQIVLAHGWDIECVPNEAGGARFRVGGLKVTSRVS